MQAGAATAAAATLPATASAQTSTDPEDYSTLEQALMALAGIQGEIDSRVERTFGDRSDAETAATDAKDEFNQHSSEWVAYINEHAALSGDIQVIALEFAPEADEETSDSEATTHTDYLVTDHDGEKLHERRNRG